MLTLFLLLFATADAQVSPQVSEIDPPDSVLFVGNSFTFYNNAVYTHLRKLLVAEDPSNREKIFLKSMTISGAILSDHKGGLMQMLDSRDWDVVILQGHSRESTDADKSPGFWSSTREFSQAIRSRGAEPVLFMTWAYAQRPEMMIDLASAFSRLGNDVDVRVIPVGLAFERARKDISGVLLHDQDDIHPSLEGTYLAAAVFYSALYGKSPVNLEYDAGLDEKLARQLRQTAWQTVLKYTMVVKYE